jgi:PAS domain S-box-containing protein
VTAVESGPANGEKPRPTSKEELFELIVESATDFAIFTIDPGGLTTSWNRGAERLFGYAEAEILGATADVIFTPEDREAGAPQAERVQASVAGRAEDERWHQRKDGSLFWASGLMMPLGDPRTGFVKITRDRTERHQAEERLRENEERFRLLATSIPQLVFRTLPNGNRTWGSPQWVAFTGLTFAESLGFGWLDAIHPDDLEVTREGWRKAQHTGEYYVEHRVRREADGAWRWHQTRARPLDAESARRSDWVGTMTDIHELRGLKDRQQVLMAELQHRTRNLLAVVQAIASQTMRRSASLDSFRAEFEDRLRALSRVQGILSRVDQPDVDLRTLAEAELAAHSEGGKSPGRITIDGPPVSLPASSAQALGLALHELATNAVKYGALSRGGGKLAVTWAVEDADPEPRLRLEWRESGVAMPRDRTSARKGYGTELIERALPYQLRAKTDLVFGPDGVRCTIGVPLGEAGR